MPTLFPDIAIHRVDRFTSEGSPRDRFRGGGTDIRRTP